MKMPHDDLRKLILAQPLVASSLKLTAQQAHVIQACRHIGVTSDELANRLNISVESASARLRHLHDVGYLERENIGHESGGRLFNYRLRSELKTNATIGTKEQQPDLL